MERMTVGDLYQRLKDMIEFYPEFADLKIVAGSPCSSFYEASRITIGELTDEGLFGEEEDMDKVNGIYID